jgi:hypothetical protein
VQSNAAQIAAQNQLRIQELTSKPTLTDAEQDELYRLKYGFSKSGGLPPGVALKPLAGAKPVLNPDGKSWSQPFTNTFGQTVLKPLPDGFVPPPAMLKGVQRADMTPDGIWYSYDVDQRGNEMPNSRRPLSTAAMAPGITTSSSHLTPHVNADGTTAMLQSTSSSTRAPAEQAAVQRINEVPLHTSAEAGPSGVSGQNGQNGPSTQGGPISAAPAAPATGTGRGVTGRGTAPTPTSTGQTGQTGSPGQPGSPAAGPIQFNTPYLQAAPPQAQPQIMAAYTRAAGPLAVGAQLNPTAAGQKPARQPGVVAGFIEPKFEAPENQAIEQQTKDYKTTELALKTLKDGDPSNQSLVLSQLVHSATGRFSPMEQKVVMSSAGWKGSMDGFIEHVKTGGLAPQLFSQIVQYAGDNLEASNAALANVRRPG